MGTSPKHWRICIISAKRFFALRNQDAQQSQINWKMCPRTRKQQKSGDTFIWGLYQNVGLHILIVICKDGFFLLKNLVIKICPDPRNRSQEVIWTILNIFCEEVFFPIEIKMSTRVKSIKNWSQDLGNSSSQVLYQNIEKLFAWMISSY